MLKPSFQHGQGLLAARSDGHRSVARDVQDRLDGTLEQFIVIHQQHLQCSVGDQRRLGNRRFCGDQDFLPAGGEAQAHAGALKGPQDEILIGRSVLIGAQVNSMFNRAGSTRCDQFAGGELAQGIRCTDVFICSFHEPYRMISLGDSRSRAILTVSP